MSTKSWLIDTKQSMIVVDPKEFPIGLGQTTREDYPTESVGVLLYEGKNILPTPFGYQSFFDQSATLNVGNLAGKLIQKTFVYQSAQLSQVLVALCEDGIYVANGTISESSPWSLVVDLSAGVVADVRRLWTTAVIGNRVFCYMQGQPKIWAFVTPDVYAEAASPSPISDATRTQVWTAWGAGLVSYIPNFINLAGQMGIFRADNRLGMWDSANAVAWSSANYIEDFKPSAQTFAGVTTFTDVQGRITLVMGHGDGFIIYATNSIVLATSLSGTPEKWKGSAVTSDIGVSFDTQIVASQPDTTHFALTMAGLLIIKDGQSQYVITEVIDFLALHNRLLSITMIEGRYLFIHWNENFPGSRYGVEAVDNSDFNDNIYKFPRPVGGSPEDGFKNLLDTYVNGSNEALQEAFKDYEPVDELPVFPPDGKLLEPCYDIKTFESTWADTTFTQNQVGNAILDSKIQVGVVYDLINFQVAPVVTVNSISTNSNAPGDWVGMQIADKLDVGMTKFNAQIAYQNAWAAANATPVNRKITKPFSIGLGDLPEPVVWERELIDDYLLNNCLISEDLKVKANECRVRLYADGDRTARIRSYVTGTETPLYGIGAAAFSGLVIATDYNQYAAKYSGLPFYILYPILPELNAALAGYNRISWDDPVPALWAMWLYPDKCISSIGVVPPVGAPEFYYNIGRDVPVDPFTNWIRTEHNAQHLPSSLSIYPRWPNSPDLGGNYATSFTKDGFNFSYIVTETAYYFGDPYVSGAFQFSVKISRGFGLSSGSITDLRAFRESLYPGLGDSSYATPVIEGDFTIENEIDYETKYSNEYVVYEAELSGWGYTPHGGFSFRKTHSRHSSTTCPMPTAAFAYTPGTSKPPEIGNNASDGGKAKPPYKWEYPDSLPFGPNSVLYQKGSLASYYPLYKGAIVYDSLLEKFGSYDSPHYMVFGTMPINRADLTVVSLPDVGIFAGAISETKEAKMFNANTPEAIAVWGKIGYYRQGVTAMQEIRAYFKEKAYGNLIVEVSMDGVAVDPTLTLAINFDGESSAILPFTAVGKWFNIRIEGRFNLTTLQINSEAAGRR